MDHDFRNLKPDRSDFLALAAAGVIAVIMFGVGFAPSALATDAVPVTADLTRIVRGVNGNGCHAGAMGKNGGQDLAALDVSCTDDPAVSWEALRAPLRSDHACAVTLGDLRRVRPEVALVRDPTADNPHHCRLSAVTPNQFVSRTSWVQ